MNTNISYKEYERLLKKIKDGENENVEEARYLKLLLRILYEGVWRESRNAPTVALFAKQLRFKINGKFPALTTKKLFFECVVGELLWFLEGSTDNNRLKEIMGYGKGKGTIWSLNAYDFKERGKAKFEGDLGCIYGKQWRKWICKDGRVIDQIKTVIEQLKKNPNNRRIVVTAWNPGELEEMALPPCHMFFQFFSANNKLSLAMTQRSCDMFLGVPFNIASYALLLEIIAREVGMEADELVITFNDAHIYGSHIEQVLEQINRKPYEFPKLNIENKEDVNTIQEMDNLKLEDFSLENYEHHPVIKGDMIV